MVPERPLTRRALFAIVAVGAGVRALHLAALADSAWPRLPLVYTESDMHAFWAWAQAIGAGDWLGRDTYHPVFAWMREMAPLETWERWWGGREIFHQAPLYPYFVAVVLGATGGSGPLGVLAVQLAIGALQPLVTFALVRRVADASAALAAAALAALYGPLVFAQGVLLRGWLAPLLEGLALVLLLRAAARERRRDWLAAGAALALAVLNRETALLLAPMAGAWLVWLRWGRWRETALAAACLAAGFALAFAPLVARNAAVGAPLLALSNRGAVTFVQHNSADSSGLWSQRNPATEQAILEWADGDGRAAVAATLHTYRGDLGAMAGLFVRKLRGTVDPVEIPSNVSFSYARELSPVLRALPGWGVAFPLAAVGLALSLRDWRRHVLLYGSLAASVAMLLVSLPLGRYRLPLAVLALGYAGIALAAGVAAARARRFGALAAGAAGVAAVALLQHAVVAVPELRSSGWIAMYGGGVEHRMAALVYAEAGRFDRAAAELARLRARANADPWTAEVAAEAAGLEAGLRARWAAQLLASGARDEARAQVAQADALLPAGPAPGARPGLLYELGVLALELGEPARGRALLARYLVAEPAGAHGASARRLLARADAPADGAPAGH